MVALLCLVVQGTWAQPYNYYECSWDKVNKQVVRTERTASGNIDDISTAKYASGGGLIGADYDYFVATKSCTIHNGLTVTGTRKLTRLGIAAEVWVTLGTEPVEGTTHI